MKNGNTNACDMSAYRAGDEVMFRFEGLLTGRVERVKFEGRKVRYCVTLDLDCEVPERDVQGLFCGAQEINGGVQQSGGVSDLVGGAAEI